MTEYNGYPVTRCQGNGQGVCRRCKALRRPCIYWTTWLYKSGGFEGALCYNCVLELKQSEEVQNGR